MRSIWKFKLSTDDIAIVQMPKGARVLSYENSCVYAMVDTEAPLVPHKFRIAGTGHDLDGVPADSFVGTFSFMSGLLVFHLFDLGEQSS